MKLNEFYAFADAIAPKRYSDEFCAKYGAYDNSGILIDTGKDVKKAVFSLDLSLCAVEKAIEEKADVIVTHHPAIYAKINGVRVSDFDPKGEKLIKCIANGISVISMHLNLDAAKDGTDDCLAEGVMRAAELYGNVDKPERAEGEGQPMIMSPVLENGYGKAYNVRKTSLENLAKGLEEIFSTGHVAAYEGLGKSGREIERVASFCGAGGDEKAVEFAVKQGADVLISSDFKHHVLALAYEKGLSVIALTHYASENYGFEKFYEKVRRQSGISCVYHTDNALL